MKKIRRRYQMYGAVQGVGFRYTAYYAAKRVGVTGFVENEYDGSVTLVVQGTEVEIAQMLQMIESSPYIHIADYKVKQLPVEEEERAFYVND